MHQPKQLRLDDQLCFALYAATNAVTRAYGPLLKQIGLTYPQYLVMLVLWQDGERSVDMIAKRLAMPHDAVMQLLDHLEASELITRQHDDADRRIVNVTVTANGAVLEKAASLAQQSVVCQTELTPHALDALRDDLKSLVDRVESHVVDPMQPDRTERMEIVR